MDTRTSRRDRLVSRRAWWPAAIAVVVALVAAAAAAFAVLAQTAKYQSVATMAIDQPRAIAASGDAGVITKLTALRSKYSGLLTTQLFAAPVAQQLGLDPNVVRNGLFAETPQNSLIILVGARTGSRDRSRTLAEAAATGLTKYVQDEQGRAGVPDGDRFTIDEVSPAGPGVKVSPTRKRVLAAGGLAALLAFAAVFAALSLRGREDD